MKILTAPEIETFAEKCKVKIAAYEAKEATTEAEDIEAVPYYIGLNRSIKCLGQIRLYGETDQSQLIVSMEQIEKLEAAK